MFLLFTIPRQTRKHFRAPLLKLLHSNLLLRKESKWDQLHDSQALRVEMHMKDDSVACPIYSMIMIIKHVGMSTLALKKILRQSLLNPSKKKKNSLNANWRSELSINLIKFQANLLINYTMSLNPVIIIHTYEDDKL